jgi:signal peptidase I
VGRRAAVILAIVWIPLFLLAIGAAWWAVSVDPRVVHMVGISMEPTLSDGDYVLISRTAAASPHRGDIVVIRDPFQPNQLFVKRIIGLPGEDVRLSGGAVFINGRRLPEPYVKYPWMAHTEWPEPGSASGAGIRGYFVLGDNRDHSSDSRSFGPVPASMITGVVVRKL